MNELAITLARIEHKVDRLTDDVAETKEQARLTNGRIKDLELWRAGLDAVRRALSWRGALALAVGAGTATAVVSALLLRAL